MSEVAKGTDLLRDVAEMRSAELAAALYEASDAQPYSDWHDVYVSFLGKDPDGFKITGGVGLVKVVKEGKIIPLSMTDFLAERVFPVKEGVDENLRWRRIAEAATKMGIIYGQRRTVEIVERIAGKLALPVAIATVQKSPHTAVVPYDDLKMRLGEMRNG